MSSDLEISMMGLVAGAIHGAIQQGGQSGIDLLLTEKAVVFANQIGFGVGLQPAYNGEWLASIPLDVLDGYDMFHNLLTLLSTPDAKATARDGFQLAEMLERWIQKMAISAWPLLKEQLEGRVPVGGRRPMFTMPSPSEPPPLPFSTPASENDGEFDFDTAHIMNAAAWEDGAISDGEQQAEFRRLIMAEVGSMLRRHLR